MHALKLKARIDSKHRIELQLPLDVPEGDAEVIILLPSPSPPPAQGSGDLRMYFDNLDRTPLQRRYSQEEIDASLAKERESWD